MSMSSIVSVLGCLFEAINILIFVKTYADKKEDNTTLSKLLCYTIILAVIIILSNTVLNLGLLNFVTITLSTFVISCIYSSNIKRNIIISIFSILILGISEIIIVFFITLLFGVTAGNVVTIEDYKILGTILSKFFAFFIFKLLCMRHRKNHTNTIKTSYMLLFLIMLVTSVTAIFLIFRLQLESKSIFMHNLSVLASLGLLYSTFFVLYLYEKLSYQVEIERNQEIFKQQIKAQSKHLDEILITQKELKKLRHDLVNHNISIQAFFENQDYKSGLDYIKNMTCLSSVTGETIETGNAALDAIINTKKSIAQSKGIEFLTNIQIPENIFIDAIDICIIFGNALDNCIEACEQADSNSKEIKISIVYENNSIICKIINTAKNNNNKFLHTTKKDYKNHGFGIENIKCSLSKYKNVFRFSQTENEFILSFVIFNN